MDSGEEEKGAAGGEKRKRGPARKEYQWDDCPPGSAYQFFKIVKTHDRGYDYQCVLHHDTL